MKALVLAAGEGTRLRPLTSNVPKPMVMVAGRPFLCHQIYALASLGIREFQVLVGWKSNRVKEFLLETFGDELEIEFLEQKQRLGTAHAIGMAEEIMNGPFICLNGDLVIEKKDLGEMISLHEKTGKPVLGAVTVDDPRRFGVIETKNGKMERIIEKPDVPLGNLVNAGVMIFTPEVFPEIRSTKRSPRGEYEITDTLNSFSRKTDIMIHELKGDWIDVAHPWDLLNANEVLMSKISRNLEGDVEEGAVIKGEVIVEAGARVRSGSYIEGPAFISTGCDVGPNCYIRSNTCLGPNCRVGAAVEIKNSIIMSGSKIPHHSYVGDSIIGERCNFGCGTKVANLRFDDRNVMVSTEKGMVDSGRRKLGVIMGDDVKTGINSVIDVGTIIFENSRIGPGALAKGRIAPGSMVF